MLWTNHKLNAIDTPYGTCMQRSKGKCTFAKQPPCLTCNGGKPCKDLGIGIFEVDVKRYENTEYTKRSRETRINLMEVYPYINNILTKKMPIN